MYIEKLPSAGELCTTWAVTDPREVARGKYAPPPSTLPVASSQFPTNAPWSEATAGPSTRTSVCRQYPFIRPLPSHLGLTPTPPVKATRPSTTRIRR